MMVAAPIWAPTMVPVANTNELCSVYYLLYTARKSVRQMWDKGSEILISAAKRQQAGADYIIICTNIMHRVADRIQAVIRIPIIHIAETTADG